MNHCISKGLLLQKICEIISYFWAELAFEEAQCTAHHTQMWWLIGYTVYLPLLENKHYFWFIS